MFVLAVIICLVAVLFFFFAAMTESGRWFLLGMVLIGVSIVCFLLWKGEETIGYPASLDVRQYDTVYCLVDIIEPVGDILPVTLRMGDGSLISTSGISGDNTRFVVARELGGKLRLFELSSKDEITSQTKFFGTSEPSKSFCPVDSVELKFDYSDSSEETN